MIKSGLASVLLLFLLLLLAGTAGAAAQTSHHMAHDAHPAFEVATVKLSDPSSHRQGIGSEGRRMTLQGQTLTSMMMFAYSVHRQQIVGAPAWAGQDRYDVDGVADQDGEPNLPQMQEMLRKLLAERFGVSLHHDRREMTYYAITVAKGGSKLTPSKLSAEDDPDQNGNGDAKQMTMTFSNNTMDHFALGMQYFLDKPVVNETGLTGRYDFKLRWLPNELQNTDADAPTSVFTAVQEQLGLKLEVKHGPVDVLILDHVNRPTEN